MKKILFFLAVFIPSIANATSITGLYQTIDDKTHMPKSIVMLYEYNNDGIAELAGRIVALYGADGTISETIAKPVKIAEKVDGAPTFIGLDIIWGMQWDGAAEKYANGKIMDPQSGRVYSSVIWQDAPNTLNVRGKIGPVGRTQHWRPVERTDLPTQLHNIDTKNWTPKAGK